MSRNKERFLWLLIVVMAFSHEALAAALTKPLCYLISAGVCSTVSATNPLPAYLPLGY